ncbi:HepT-like ribonuclease domain-containing protein [Methanosarcina mazei]
MRDRLIHAYFNVDYDLVWDTAKNRVPMARRFVSQLRCFLHSLHAVVKRHQRCSPGDLYRTSSQDSHR